MSAKPLVCPKCQGEMVRGFFVAEYAHVPVMVSTWVEGPPERSFWTGVKVPKEKCLPTATFRCATCGYLESYAQAEFGPQ